MLQNPRKKNPHQIDDISIKNSELIYIPESKSKINKDIAKHQYFSNFIQPDYNVQNQFAIRSREDGRFQTRVDLLLERETEMRQGTFNPLLYKHVGENNEPQNSVNYIQTPSIEEFDKIKYSSPKFITTKPENYTSIISPGIVQRDNIMNLGQSVYKTNLDNIYTQPVKTPQKSNVIQYKNSLFSLNEKITIYNYHIKQDNIDPLLLLNKKAYTMGSLNNEYKTLHPLYSVSNPLKNKILKALKQIEFIIKQNN
mgnify:FL=1|tara:strand:+ start:1817 stop:2578 length:762 start_codon:yes stop_codon:yes gene_type:complete